MTKKYILIISVCFSVVVASCSQSDKASVAQQQENLAVKDGKLINKTNTNNSKKVTERANKSALKVQPIAPLSQRPKSAFFNGEKYLFTGGKLKKGTKVRRITMAEFGIVKGTFVIIVNTNEMPEISFKYKQKIAKNTYRITPKETSDLMMVYQELVNNKFIARVELEVLYSGKSTEAASY